ncbi:MAG: nucleotide exchange factor GrpE [Planctomycetota bacterium]
MSNDTEHQHDDATNDGAINEHGFDPKDLPQEFDLDADPDGDRIAELENKLQDAEARALRSLADFQNFQRRAANNEIEARKQGVTSVVAGLLPVLDNFELALQQKEAGGTAEQILGGVEMVKAELLRALETQGVASIRPEPGDELDPGRHEAISQMPVDGIEPGRIGTVYQVGYTLGERVLRPAKVVVAIEPPEPATDDAGAPGNSGGNA